MAPAYVVYNKTDSIFADPRTFPTVEEAQKVADEFPKRYAMQGYYKTADGRRIDPKDVELEVVPCDDDHADEGGEG